MLFVYIFSDRK